MAAKGALLVSDAVEAEYGARLEAAAPGRPRVVLRGEAPDGDPASVELAFFSGDLYPERTRDLARALHRAEGLRWLHTFSAGVDHPWFQRFLERGVRLTSSAGAAAVPIAQSVMLYLLALTRDLPRFLADQRSRRWSPREVEDLQGRTLAVLGLGPIGLEVARLGRAFRMEVIGLRRRVRGDEPCETWTFERLEALLERADFVVLALPLTAETRHLLDERRLARLRPHARLVNVGRGSLVDERALARALAEGRLAGAALDVFEEEPLPRESPLWRMPGVILTPHCAGQNPGNRTRAAGIFLENLARYERGEPLANEIPGERSSIQ